MSSTVAYRAALVREIKKAMKRIESTETPSKETYWLQVGLLDAYGHILSLVDDLEDL